MRNYEIIKERFEALKEKYGLHNEELVGEGAVYYMNGNDGTDFDWQANDRVCEFMTFYKDTEMGALRVLYGKDGSETVFFYRSGEFEPEEREEKEAPFDTAELAAYMYGSFDQKGIWDKPITDWNFPDYCWIEDEEENLDEEDEWNEDDCYE